METSEHEAQTSGEQSKKRFRSVEEKRRIVEQTLGAGASVTQVARSRGVNRDQVFHWRKLYREGRLASTPSARLLPVQVAEERPMAAVKDDAWRSGTMEIQLPKGTLRIVGAVDVAALRAAIASLVA